MLAVSGLTGALSRRNTIALEAPPSASSSRLVCEFRTQKLYYLAQFQRPPLQLSIYPEPDPEMVLEEVHSELERNIGIARTHVTYAYDASKTNVHSVVGKWINVEEKVERECRFGAMLYIILVERIH